MRASIGLGLIAIGGLFACTASAGDTSATLPGWTPGDDKANTGTSTDPTEPAAPAPPPPPVDPTDPATPPAPVVSGIAVTDVAVFQAVKVPVIQDGVPVKSAARKAPVVAKRPGIIRVYVTPGSGWSAREITAELRLVAGDKKAPIIRETKRISAPSKEEDPKSTFNLEVPGESLPPGVTFQVALTADDGEKSPQGNVDGRFPRDGSFQDLGAELSGKVKVVVVPIKYDADGSGRTPDLGAAQLERYKKTMMAWYPVSEIEVTTHAPYAWTTTISNNGNGFSNVLRAVTQLRQQDQVEKDVYYYGLLAPGASFKAYCQGGCVTGLSTVVDHADAAGMRASVGVGFGDVVSAQTMAHEVGHAHGREHAPCGGPQGVDPHYPYQGAQIGVWGYDIFAKTFIAPTKGRDMMGYCQNQWVSDYTYNALFERISSVSLSKDVTRRLPPAGRVSAAKTSYRIAAVNGSGELTWDGDLDFDEELTGGTIREASFVTESGAQMVTRPAHFYRFDHLPGGFLFVPAESNVNWKAVEVAGFAQKLAR